ncbi:MAG TPA: periplasmic heavy metal sensor [Caulobacteraceae bacterium]|nr:periplasmic heavy metal sensor [Caulobacteraceae bacterium]
MNRGWKIAVAVSLALNLFLAGSIVGVLVVGARMIGERADVRRGRGPDMNAVLQALPQARRAALREIMRAQALDAAPDLREAAAARRQALQLMGAAPYDAAAVASALERARAADGRARARIDATLATRLGELSPQERTLFARMMTRGGEGLGRGRRGDGQGHPEPGVPSPPGPPPR